MKILSIFIYLFWIIFCDILEIGKIIWIELFSQRSRFVPFDEDIEDFEEEENDEEDKEENGENNKDKEENGEKNKDNKKNNNNKEEDNKKDKDNNVVKKIKIILKIIKIYFFFWIINNIYSIY